MPPTVGNFPMSTELINIAPQAFPEADLLGDILSEINTNYVHYGTGFHSLPHYFLKPKYHWLSRIKYKIADMFCLENLERSILGKYW